MEYIQTPICPYKAGRTFTKMSQGTSTTEIAKTPKAKYNKTKGEHFKDVVIAILITGIVAFIGGMVFQTKQQNAIETAVNAVSPTVQAKAPVKK